MELITSIILIVFAVLQIILFFKIWGMTNDVKAIKESLILQSNAQKCIASKNDNKFNIGNLVVNKDGKQMRIKEIKDGKYACYTNGGMHFEGIFEENEIKPFGE